MLTPLFTFWLRVAPGGVVQDAIVEADRQVEDVRAVYEDVHERLWRAVLAYTSSAEVADEAVAEAFAQLLRRGEGVRDPAAWVWRSAFRIAAGDMQRRRSAARAVAEPELGVSVPEPAFDLLAALRHLTDQQRACVVLCDLGDHTAVAAARLLGTTAATVRVQRMRARRRLRGLLEDDDD